MTGSLTIYLPFFLLYCSFSFLHFLAVCPSFFLTSLLVAFLYLFQFFLPCFLPDFFLFSSLPPSLPPSLSSFHPSLFCCVLSVLLFSIFPPAYISTCLSVLQGICLSVLWFSLCFFMFPFISFHFHWFFDFPFMFHSFPSMFHSFFFHFFPFPFLCPFISFHLYQSRHITIITTLRAPLRILTDPVEKHSFLILQNNKNNVPIKLLTWGCRTVPICLLPLSLSRSLFPPIVITSPLTHLLI